MAHDRVTLARSFFKKLGCHNSAQRKELLDRLGFDDPRQYKAMVKRESKVIDDFRVIDMFDIASRQNITPAARQGNWVQPYQTDDDVRRYVTAQFGDYEHIRKQFVAHKRKIAKKVARKTTIKKKVDTKTKVRSRR